MKKQLSTLVVLPTLLVILSTNLQGQQAAIKTLKTWITSMHDADIVARVRTAAQGEPFNSFVEEVYLSKEEDVCLARRWVVLKGREWPTDIFGAIGKQHFSARCEDIDSFTSGGRVTFTKEPGPREICKFLNMFTIRHLLLRSRSVGDELFPIIESRTKWVARNEGESTYYESLMSDDDELAIMVNNENPAWPQSIQHTYTWISDPDKVSYKIKLQLQFSKPTRFDGIEHELPSQASASVKLIGNTNSETSEHLELVSVKKRAKKVLSWSDVFKDMPDGLEVEVSTLPMTKFEWRDNEIVRSSDHRKLLEIE